MSRLSLLVLSTILLCLPNPVSARQGIAKPGKAPETSKAADFDPATLSKLAVLLVGNDTRRDVQTEHQRIVEDAFLQCLIAKGHTIVARSDVDALLREKKFQGSGLTEDNATSVGKFLNVPAVMVVRITEVSAEPVRTGGVIGKVSIGARLLNVETGSILWSGKHSETVVVASKGAGSGLVLETAATLAESFPDKKTARDIAYARSFDPKSIAKLAIIMIDQRGLAGKSVQTDQQRLVEDSFIQVLVQKGYGLVSRSDLQSVAKEQQFQRSGLSEDNAVALGKLLNVPAVLVVRITDFATESIRNPARRGAASTISRAALAARLIEVSSGEVLWTQGEWISREIGSKSEATDLLDLVAKDVAGFFPPVPESSGVLLQQAERVATLGQTSAAIIYYNAALKMKLSAAEKKLAERQLKALTSRKAALSH